MPPKRKIEISESRLTDTWGRNNRKLEDKICGNCGIPFRPKAKTSKYCSNKCRWAQNGKSPKAKKGSRWKNKSGYIELKIWVDEFTQIRCKEHRYIMEQHLGRKLLPNEIVHHINGIKDDNRVENLQIMQHGEHSSLTNNERIYKTGYKMNISDEERKKRSEAMKEKHKKYPQIKARLKNAKP